MPATLTPPAALAAAPHAAPRTVPSALLGPVLADEEAVYHFPAGLYGFDAARDFVLVPSGKPGLSWLQSLDDARLTFLVADPAHFYSVAAGVTVPAVEAAMVGRDAPGHAGARRAAPEDLAVFVVVTLPDGPGDAATVNLQAPLLLHPELRCGRQVVLSDGRRRIRVPIAIS